MEIKKTIEEIRKSRLKPIELYLINLIKNSTFDKQNEYFIYYKKDNISSYRYSIYNCQYHLSTNNYVYLNDLGYDQKESRVIFNKIMENMK